MRAHELDRWALLSILVAASLVSISCSSTVEGESSIDGVAETVVAAEAPVDSVASEPPARTTTTSGGLIDCVNPDQFGSDVSDLPHLSDTFRATELWLHVDAFTPEDAELWYEIRDDKIVGETQVQVRPVVDGVVADDGENVTILMGSEPGALLAAVTDPSIESTYLGVRHSWPELTDTDFTVWQIFSTFVGGGGTHVGGCEAQNLNRCVAIEHGPKLTSYASGLLSHTGDGLANFVEGRPDPATDTIALLNSVSADEETLEALTSLTIFYSIQGEAEDRAVCTLASAGWNECVSLAAGEGIVLPAYVAADGLLDAYLFDGSGPPNKPLALLESIQFESEFLQLADPIVRIDIDADSVAVEEFTNSVLVGNTAGFSAEIEDDPYWQVEGLVDASNE